MFISSIRMKGRSDKRKEIIQTLSGISYQVRRKKGCLNAKSYQAIDDKDAFYLVEEWRTQQDMEEYMSSKLFAALLGIKTILVEKPDVKIMFEESSQNNEKKGNRQFP